MPNVAILAYEQVALFELACAAEVFSIPPTNYRDWYQSEVVCFEKKGLGTAVGVNLVVTQVADLSAYDILVIPSWNVDNNHVRLDLAEKINDFALNNGRLVCIGSGVFLLAQLGLLQHKLATTHWRYAPLFKSRFPLVKYVEDLYTHDQNISCAAGSAAALDLGIDIIRQDFGSVMANQVAKRLLISPHREGGQTRFIDHQFIAPKFAETALLTNQRPCSQTIRWVLANLATQITVDDLARQAKMSRRSFDRHFKAEVGASPKAWLNEQRIERAKYLLENFDLSIEQLAKEVGYENSITLRFNFNKYVGVSPSQYQLQFNSTR